MIYIARYTHQQRSEMEKWSMTELDEWYWATSDFIVLENKGKPD